jgi:hypothetical protein
VKPVEGDEVFPGGEVGLDDLAADPRNAQGVTSDPTTHRGSRVSTSNSTAAAPCTIFVHRSQYRALFAVLGDPWSALTALGRNLLIVVDEGIEIDSGGGLVELLRTPTPT